MTAKGINLRQEWSLTAQALRKVLQKTWQNNFHCCYLSLNHLLLLQIEIFMSSLDVPFQTALIGTSTITVRTLELLNDSIATLLQMHVQSRLRMVEFTTFWTHRLKMINLNNIQGYQQKSSILEYEIVDHRPHVIMGPYNAGLNNASFKLCVSAFNGNIRQKIS